MTPVTQMSPRRNARIAGILYLISVATAIFAEAFVRGRLLYAVALIPVICFAIATVLLYRIFKPVSPTLAVLAASANLTGLALEAFELQPHGLNIAMVLHGIYCLLIGYLVFRSRFLPQILGALMALAGLTWLAYLFPKLEQRLHPYTQAMGFIGEASLMLWLLVLGVNPSN